MDTKQNIRVAASRRDWEAIEREIEPSFITQKATLNQVYKCMDCENILASAEPYMDRVILTTKDGQLKLTPEEEDVEYDLRDIEPDPATGRLLYIKKDRAVGNEAKNR